MTKKQRRQTKMQIQAAVYFPVTVDMEVNMSDPRIAREDILDHAGYILETSMIKPTIDNVMALATDGKSYVDITSLLEERVSDGCARAQGESRYRIVCWIPVDSEDEPFYGTLEEARKDLEHCQFLQPENIYKLKRVDGGDDDKYGELEGLARE